MYLWLSLKPSTTAQVIRSLTQHRRAAEAREAEPPATPQRPWRVLFKPLRLHRGRDGS